MPGHHAEAAIEAYLTASGGCTTGDRDAFDAFHEYAQRLGFDADSGQRAGES